MTCRFDQRGVVGENGVDLARDGAIDPEARRRENTSAHCRMAVIEGMAERTPNARAS